MNNWVLILFVVDVAFMIGILFMFFTYKKSNRLANVGLAVEGGAPALDTGYPTEIVEKLQEELSFAESITKKLDKKRGELDELEKSLQSKKKAMDRVLKRASTEGRVHKRKWSDTYEGAVSMLDSGASVDTVIEKFDLLKGEAELITSLSTLRN